jgi:EpsI family protein
MTPTTSRQIEAAEMRRAHWPWQSPGVRVLTLVLAAQGALFYAATTRSENTPEIPPLATFPGLVGEWRLLQEGHVDAETMAVLQADDTLTRFYGVPNTNQGLNLFIAFFKTQRTGKTPHSPKNCLPGSGWEPLRVGVVSIPVAGRQRPLEVNKYVVARGEHRSVVLYWYQSRDRVVASEYWAKIWMVLDSIRYNRSDTSLIRITVPVMQGDEERAQATAVRFARSIFPLLRKHLPS